MLNRYYTPTEGHTHLTGLFATHADSQRAIHRLEALGVTRDNISVIYRDHSMGTAAGGSGVATDSGTRALEGAGTGSAIGGTLGAVLGVVAVTATSVVLPGVGVLIAGPLAGALAGAGAGGLTGGVLGALSGAGIPEEQARVYERGIGHDGVLVIADVPASLEKLTRGVLQDQM